MSSGEYPAVPEVFANASFVRTLPREDKNASEEVFTNGSFVEIGEDEVVSEEVFSNGSLPESLTSPPLLPLYQFVVNQLPPNSYS